MTAGYFKCSYKLLQEWCEVYAIERQCSRAIPGQYQRPLLSVEEVNMQPGHMERA
jgi:hypothetical protein